MADLAIAAVIVLAVSTAMFFLGRKLAQRLGPTHAGVAAAALVAIMAPYALFLHERLWMTFWLPFSSAAVLGNLFVPAAGLLSGVLVAQASQAPPWRRRVAACLLAALAVYSLLYPMLGTPPQTSNIWVEGRVCLQSDASTCSPSSAATLLDRYGIEATEGEMARLCLTRREGTTAVGLYRGLSLKTADTGWRVQSFVATPKQLCESQSWPCILLVQLDENSGSEDRYIHQWGWLPGEGHSVVLLDRLPDGRFIIGDPAIGRELWTYDDLQKLWAGEAVRLVKR